MNMCHFIHAIVPRRVECGCLLSNKNVKPKDCVEIGVDALSLYHKAGFIDTEEMSDEEIVLQLDL